VRLPAIATAALVALAGCGGGGGTNADRFSGAKQDVARVLDDLQRAARAGDAKGICDRLFTARLAQELAKAKGGAPCPQRVRRTLVRKDETITARSIDVRGDAALAVVKEQNGNVTRLVLRKVAGRWRVDAIAAVG
jgi:hypothetical protein